jgi:uncharacterized small protein (DUF1192 family)
MSERLASVEDWVGNTLVRVAELEKGIKTLKWELRAEKKLHAELEGKTAALEAEIKCLRAAGQMKQHAVMNLTLRPAAGPAV